MVIHLLFGIILSADLPTALTRVKRSADRRIRIRIDPLRKTDSRHDQTCNSVSCSALFVGWYFGARFGCSAGGLCRRTRPARGQLPVLAFRSRIALPRDPQDGPEHPSHRSAAKGQMAPGTAFRRHPPDGLFPDLCAAVHRREPKRRPVPRTMRRRARRRVSRDWIRRATTTCHCEPDRGPGTRQSCVWVRERR